ARPDLDSTIRGVGQVTLHTEHDVPTTRSGEGSQRLLAIAAQLSTVSSPGVMMLDEIERGLEPHRIQYIINEIQDRLNAGNLSQVILTTHSPRAIRELRANQIS